MTALKIAGKVVGLFVLTGLFWLGFNYARAQWQDHVARQQALEALVGIVNYNLQQGKLVLPGQPAAPSK